MNPLPKRTIETTTANLLPRRLRFGAGVALFAGCLLSAAMPRAWAQDADWEIVKLKDRDYVTGSQIADFYKFEMTRDGERATFSSPTMKMEAVMDTDEVRLNGTTFLLSFPITEHGGNILVSRVDLCKLLDPVFRPFSIKEAHDFDTVVIDPGHGGKDSGSKGVYAYEKIYTLDLAKKLWKQLILRGFKVRFTRLDDEDLTLPERVTRANEAETAIFVSLHFNAHPSRQPSGLETYAITPPGTPTTGEYSAEPHTWRGNLRDAESIALATAVHTSALRATQAADRGVRRARFHVLRGLTMPGILFEGGYITNPKECEEINQDTYRYGMAVAIADGIDNFRAALRKE